MNTNDWIKCPICECKTRVQIRPDTVLENFPLFCPRCKNESIICVKNMNVSVLKSEKLKENTNS